MVLRDFWDLLKGAAREWWNDNTFRMAAALAFYTVFSISPIIIIAIGVAGVFFGREQASEAVVRQIQSLIGSQGGEAIRQLAKSLPGHGNSVQAILIGAITTIIGSTVVFSELQADLNQIWDVKVKAGTGIVRDLIRVRVQSFAIALAVGFLLLVSLVVSTALSGLASYVGRITPEVPWVWQAVNVAVSLVVTSLLFALIYRYLPDVQITWGDVAIGALTTAVLFTFGKYLIGVYLGRLALATSYGAAGSFALLLIWVYYSTLICFFGAEFTQVYARRFGSKIRPTSYATRRGIKPDAP